MRSCIYCGKELTKDEKCDCPIAQAKRNNTTHQPPPNNTQNTRTNNYYHKKNTNSYHTGYTKRENPIKSAWTRYFTRKTAARANNATYRKHPKRNLFFDLVSFFKSPVTTVFDTSHMSRSFVFLIAASSGALLGICVYLIFLYVLQSATHFTPALPMPAMLGNEFLSGLLFSLIFGILSGTIFYILYCVSFFLVNRLIFRVPARFSDYLKALALCPLPIAVSGIIGIIMGFASLSLLLITILCGFIFSAFLTYEVMKKQWIGFSQNRIIYGTLLGFIIYGLILSSMTIGI